MKKLLEIKNLSFSYNGVPTLHDINLTIHEGEVVSLIGANGAGKTTLMKIISGLLVPQSGDMLLEGKSLPFGMPQQQILLGIAQSPEGRQVFPDLTVEENLLLGGFYRSRSDNLEQLKRCYDLFPRLHERSHQLAMTLSGGEQQMLAIGRALMSRPRLLLLDEPNLGLAPILSELIFSKITELRDQGITILLAEQNAYRALKISHRACVLDLGRIALEDVAANLIHNPQILKAYLGHTAL